MRTTFIFAALFVVCLFNKQLEKQIADDEVLIFQRLFKAAVSLLSTALASAAWLLKGVLDKLHLVFRSRNSLKFCTCQPIHYSKDPTPPHHQRYEAILQLFSGHQDSQVKIVNLLLFDSCPLQSID